MKKTLIQLLLLLTPWCIRRIGLRIFLGYRIDSSARIGFSLINCDLLEMGAKAYIGHLTIIKGLRSLEIGAASRIGNLNWISATRANHPIHFTTNINRDPSLIIGRDAAITNRHLIDCTDRITIGEFASMGGWRSQILTHSADIKSCRQVSAPVIIGRYCCIGTGAVLLKGTSLPDFSVLGAGSVLTKAMKTEGVLYSGVPAVTVREMDRESLYFKRLVGFID